MVVSASGEPGRFFIKLGQAVRCQIAAQTTATHDDLMIKVGHFGCCPKQCISNYIRDSSVLVFVKGPPESPLWPTSPLSHEGMLLAAALLSKPRLSNICRPTFLFLCQHRRPDPNATGWIKLGHVGFGQMMSETRLCVFLWEGPNHMVIKLGSCGARCFILWSQICEERAAQPTCPNQRTVGRIEGFRWCTAVLGACCCVGGTRVGPLRNLRQLMRKTSRSGQAS